MPYLLQFNCVIKMILMAMVSTKSFDTFTYLLLNTVLKPNPLLANYVYVNF